MAWSWSHTPEAYHNAESNLRALDDDTLRTIAEEWHVYAVAGDDPTLNDYAEARGLISQFPADTLADWIWEKASEFATCDNGGFHAHVCPYGCHTVSFDPAEVSQ